MTKWPDRPHWVFAGVYLGSDAHGDWIGFRSGARFTRPGADYVAPYDQVGLVPAEALPERGWLAAFHSPAGQVRVYVDVATPPMWEGCVLRSVDLDLDVVQGRSGRVWVDDEDEFAAHRLGFGYPDDVVVAALASRDRLLADLAAGVPPWDGDTHRPWLALVTEG